MPGETNTLLEVSAKFVSSAHVFSAIFTGKQKSPVNSFSTQTYFRKF